MNGMRQHVERRIARRLILDGIRAGYSIEVEHELLTPSTKCKDILDAMFTGDDDLLLFHKKGGQTCWVQLIYGNGCEVIHDYSVDLDHIMDGATNLSAKYA